MELTQADKIALTRQDDYHFCYKGIVADCRGDGEEAAEYYRLGALLGDGDSLSNLALCYLYGKGVPKSPSLALAYFQIAARHGSLDAITMAARIYRRGTYGEPDPDLAAYYLLWGETIGRRHPEKLEKCDFFCQEIAQAKMPGGILPTDLADAYRYLKLAEAGFQREINEGRDYMEKYRKEVEQLLDDPAFDAMLGREREEQQGDGTACSNLFPRKRGWRPSGGAPSD